MFSCIDVTLIIRYMLWGMCHMLAVQQIVVPDPFICFQKKRGRHVRADDKVA
jgi:hypothetical protein